MCGTEGEDAAPRPAMPTHKQPEADRLPAQAASTVRLSCSPGINPPPQIPIPARISTIQVFVSNTKTAKLGSFRQIALDTAALAPACQPLPELASFREIPARPGLSPQLPVEAEISTTQTAESNPQTQKMASFRQNPVKPQPRPTPRTAAVRGLSRTPRSPAILPCAGKSLGELVYTVARSGDKDPCQT